MNNDIMSATTATSQIAATAVEIGRRNNGGGGKNQNGVGGKRNQFKGPCYLKMLVNNLVAGSIIGKNGSIITSIEQQTGCTLKLSPSNCYFPKTTERVVVMSGKLEEINNAVLIILDKAKEIASQYAYDPHVGHQLSKLSCKLVVPKSAVSGIIGKEGQQVKELQASTLARIHISVREEGLNERTVTISGTPSAMQNAALRIIQAIQNSPNLKDHMYVVYNKHLNSIASSGGNDTGGIKVVGNVPLNNAIGGMRAAGSGGGANGAPIGVLYHQYLGEGASGYNSSVLQYAGTAGMNPIVHPVYGGLGVTGAQHQYDTIYNTHCEITVQIPDNCVGGIIGKNGGCLTDIIHATGARIQVSPKGDLIPDTNNRKVVISGGVLQVHQAHIMLLQRLYNQ